MRVFTLQSVYWRAADNGSLLSVSGSVLERFSLINVDVVPALRLAFSNAGPAVAVELRSSFCYSSVNISGLQTSPVDVFLNMTYFSRSVSLTGAIRTIRATAATFQRGRLLVANSNSTAPTVVTIMGSRFNNGTSLGLINATAIVRSSQFYPRSVGGSASLPEESVTQVDVSTSSLDARGNYWGHESGPYSCCTPKGEGAFAIRADVSSWCEDAACTKLHSPIDESKQYSHATPFKPPFCQFDTYCPLQLNAVLGAMGGLLAFACVLAGIFVGVSFYKYKTALSQQTHPGSYSQSGFVMMSRQDGDALRNRTLLFVDTLSIVVAGIFLVVGLLPTVIYPQARYTELNFRVAAWYQLMAFFVIISRGIRILSTVWHIAVVKTGRPTYRSLLANVVVSSLVLQFTATFRTTALSNDFSAQKGFLNYDPLGPLELPMGFLIGFTKFYWVVWFLLLLSDFLLAAPVIWSTLRIIKKRDFAEVELLRRQLEYNPLGAASELLRAPRLRRASIFISWFSLVTGILMFALITFLAVMTGLAERGPFADWTPGGDVSQTITIFLTRINAMFSCAAVSVVAFFIFRWRYYETALVWVYISVAIGAIANALEMGIFFIWYGIMHAGRTYIIGTAITASLTFLMLVIPTILAFILVRRMKRELAPQITSSIYEQLEDTLSS